ncbi:MAG TPA: hypothetical protein VMC07_03150 [Candidatus Omnitrophota bacterium]|nr:hypothetical protein [Candidatus Omnitrophota bacterium]
MMDKMSAIGQLDEILETLKGTTDKTKRTELKVQYLEMMDNGVGEVLSKGERKDYLNKLRTAYGE